MENKLKIRTKPYGEIEVNERQRITFPEGLIGFEDVHEYFLIDSKEGPFYWLQAGEFPELAFLLVDPRLFMEDYRLEVKEHDVRAIGAEQNEDLLDFAIVTVPEDPQKISANLMGPIIVNRKTRTALQVISEHDGYTVKHYILEELKKRRKLPEETEACSSSRGNSTRV